MSGLVAAFSRLHRASPGRTLIHVPAARLSWTADDIWQAHLTYAAALRACGLRPGQLLVSAAGNHASAVPLFLAARALGLALAATDAGTTPGELADVSEAFDAAAIVGHAGSSALPRARASMPDGLTALVRSVTARDDYGETALLKITSGSTGQPRAARTSDAHLIADSRQIVTGMGIGPDDTQLAVIPLSHAYGASVILVPLVLQGTPMVLRESFVPQQLPADAAAFGARTFPGVPYMFEYFLANPPAGGWPASLGTLVSAGSPLSATTVRQFAGAFGAKIHSFYGASEAGGISYDAGDSLDAAGSVGTPLPGVAITLQPDEDAPAGSGRVHVQSAGVADGYVDAPGDDFCRSGFLTGDYGTFDAEGRLRLTGRVSSFINVAGRKVEPAEVEQVLRQLPGVRDVRVVPVADRQRGEQVVACLAVDPSERHGITALSVRRFCAPRLAPHKIPRAIVLLDAIPLTVRGKTDRRALDRAIRARIEGITEQMC